MAPNQAYGQDDPWNVDEMDEVADEDLFPYGHGPTGGD